MNDHTWVMASMFSEGTYIAIDAYQAACAVEQGIEVRLTTFDELLANEVGGAA